MIVKLVTLDPCLASLLEERGCVRQDFPGVAPRLLVLVGPAGVLLEGPKPH